MGKVIEFKMAVQNIYFVSYEATPDPGFPGFSDIGGAIVNCWIKAASCKAAKAIARKSIEEDAWKITRLEAALHVCAGDDPDWEEYYQQALIEGESYLYCTWPCE